MRIIFIVMGVLWAAPAHAQTDFYLNPVDLRRYDVTNQCLAPDICHYSGINLGMQPDASSTQVPQYYIGASIANSTPNTGGNVVSMVGVNSTQQFGTGGTCTSLYGVNSTAQVSGFSSRVTTLAHLVALDYIATGASVGTSYGLYYDPFTGSVQPDASYSVYSPQAIAKMRQAGPARIGDTGDPTAGYDLDVEGPVLVNGGANIGQATSTPGATPTATAATPTATSVTPTPTPTSTPPHLVKQDVGLDGNLTLVGNAARSITMGPCTRSPCSAKNTTITGGAAAGTGAGGKVTLQGGAGAALGQVGGNVEVLATGSGGGNAQVSAARGFLSVLGRLWFDGDITSRLATSASRPTFGAGCGSTASDALATNNQGRITMSGTGQTGSCVVTFGDGGFTNAPACFAQFSTDGGAAGHGIKTVVSAAASLTINNAVLATGIAQNFAANDIVQYWCIGRE